MKLTTPLFATTALTIGVALALASPLAASAHFGVDAPTTSAGAYTVLTFSLPHGCDASPTTVVRIGLPESIASVTPTVNAGWVVSTVTSDLAEPAETGQNASTRTDAVVYTADTPFPDGLRTTFALSLQLPADAEGEKLEFPVLQTCEVGETNWNESTVDGEDEPAYPAPAILVTAASGDGHGATDSATESTHSDDEVKVTTEATPNTVSAAATDDVLARVLGAGGLVVGAVGIVLAITARRKTTV